MAVTALSPGGRQLATHQPTDHGGHIPNAPPTISGQAPRPERGRPRGDRFRHDRRGRRRQRLDRAHFTGDRIRVGQRQERRNQHDRRVLPQRGPASPSSPRPNCLRGRRPPASSSSDRVWVGSHLGSRPHPSTAHPTRSSAVIRPPFRPLMNQEGISNAKGPPMALLRPSASPAATDTRRRCGPEAEGPPSGRPERPRPAQPAPGAGATRTGRQGSKLIRLFGPRRWLGIREVLSPTRDRRYWALDAAAGFKARWSTPQRSRQGAPIVNLCGATRTTASCR